MANKQRGFVDIELDKPRKLRYTLNSLAELEDKLGVPLSELNDKNLGIKQIRAFLWAGLIHEDSQLTEQVVGDMVEFDKVGYISDKISEAFKIATQKN